MTGRRFKASGLPSSSWHDLIMPSMPCPLIPIRTSVSPPYSTCKPCGKAREWVPWSSHGRTECGV